MTNNCRIYGKKPFDIAVIHGGPGGTGEMAPVAKEISKRYGVLEPLQTEESLEGQIKELRQTLQEKANVPVTLIGFSWGAMLSFIITARYPELVKKLIMVGSGLLEKKGSNNIVETRLSRLTLDERKRLKTIFERIKDPSFNFPSDFPTLISKADGYDVILSECPQSCDYNILRKVWPEVEVMRSSGELIKLREHIRCPLVLIHGDYDPHPVESLEKSLDGFVADYKLILLKKCGHRPWAERHAKDAFYDAIEKQINHS